VFQLLPGIPVNKRNIIEHIARLIIDGSLPANQILPNEIALAAKFGVSRTMIRDALRSLEEKGFIERKTNVGTRVRSIHSWNLLDSEVLEWSSRTLTQSRFLLSLMELRLIIEPQAAALAAIRANDQALQDIRDSFLRMRSQDEETGGLLLDTDADIEFHKAVIKASGNLFVAQFGGVIRAALHHTIYLSNKASVDPTFSLECHQRVLEGIENRDPKLAYDGMWRVLKNAISDLNLQITGVVIAHAEAVSGQ
jgi:DNA-binding FadR family transcriptional regulator